MKKVLLRIVTPILVLAGGATAAGALVFMEPKKEDANPEHKQPSVEYIAAQTSPTQAIIEATGTVKPAQQVQLIPQVSGRVVWVSPSFIPGGRFAKGDVLLRIDPSDYRLAVTQEESRVAQAKMELQLEQGRQDVAKAEWDLLGNGRSRDQAPLALRKPQLTNVRTSLLSAESGLKRAQLNLTRTTIRAPFNGMVLDKQIDRGQVVATSKTLGTVFATDELWVQVSVPVEKLKWIDIPEVNAEQGSLAQIKHQLAGSEQVLRQGKVLRLLGELENKSRTAQLLLTIEDPMATPNGGLPLLNGAYVQVQIEGRQRDKTYSIPAQAVFQGDHLWLVDNNNQLQQKQIDIAWRSRDKVVVASGLSAGDRVVVSPMSLPISGMPVSPVATTAQTAMKTNQNHVASSAE